MAIVLWSKMKMFANFWEKNTNCLGSCVFLKLKLCLACAVMCPISKIEKVVNYSTLFYCIYIFNLHCIHYKTVWNPVCIHTQDDFGCLFVFIVIFSMSLGFFPFFLRRFLTKLWKVKTTIKTIYIFISSAEFVIPIIRCVLYQCTFVYKASFK